MHNVTGLWNVAEMLLCTSTKPHTSRLSRQNRPALRSVAISATHQRTLWY